MHGSAPPSEKTDPLLAEVPFRLGAAVVDPLTRTLSGPGGTAVAEPRVMHVLVVLARSAGAVVTRDRLMAECWRGRFVGDDALNRAIGEVRRLARGPAAGGFAIETAPRAGYRLTGAVPSPIAAANGTRGSPLLSRRALLAAVGVGGVAAVAGWSVRPRAIDPRATALFDQAAIVLRNQEPNADARGIALLRRARALAPDDAQIAGRLALASGEAVERVPPTRTAAALEDAELAVRSALALDPEQPEARVAQTMLIPAFGRWLDVERRLRAVLADHPGHAAASAALAPLLMSVGRVRESAAVNLPLAEADLLSPAAQYRRIYNLWNLERFAEMDRVADRASQLWPRHPGIWFARLWTLAFTGRPALALRMLLDEEARPPLLADQRAALRQALVAMTSGDRADRDRAVSATVEAARATVLGAVNAVMVLTRLGALDDAFAVADGYLRRRGPLAGPVRPMLGEPVVDEQRRRKTIMLFVPATAPLRRDPRFRRLCDAIGLTDYWRDARIRPDFLGHAGRPT